MVLEIVSQYHCSRENLSELEIPLDKELAAKCANCLIVRDPYETLGADPGCDGIEVHCL